MNIFFLDENPRIAAQSLCDKHVVKMVLETAQMCCTAMQLNFELTPLPSTYKPAFVNHPMTKWVGETDENMNWALLHGICIGDEYTYRYGKKHKSQQVLLDIQDHYFPILNDLFYYNRYGIEISEPPLCVPDHCTAGPGGYRMNYVDVYRKYYNLHKSHLLTYTNRDKPEWLQKLD